MDGDARRLLDSHDPVVARIGRSLTGAVSALETAMEWLLVNSAEAGALCAAGSVPFLRLTGTVVGGWLSALLADAASKQLAAGGVESAFLHAKVQTAGHYAAHVLVQAAMLRDVVVNGGDTTLGLADEQF
jgi:hypothetical protein